MQPTKAVIEPIAPTADSRQVYAGPEFERWARAEGLIAAERFLIEHYLSRDGSILEAGAGGGRILRALAQLGFEHISGFDNVPALIEQALRHDPSRAAAYRVLDARDIAYQDGEFDQIIYLQQIISFISDAEGQRKAVAEAYRVLKPGGIGLFSFLCFESRLRSVWYRAMIGYLVCLRALARRRQSAQSMPWLWVGGRFNLSAILDRPPHVIGFVVTTREVPKLVQSKRKTVGIRIPAHEVIRAITRELGPPGDLHDAQHLGEPEPHVDPHEIDDAFRGLAMVLDAGGGGVVPTTVVDLTQSPPLIVREGAGSVDALMQ